MRSFPDASSDADWIHLRTKEFDLFEKLKKDLGQKRNDESARLVSFQEQLASYQAQIQNLAETQVNLQKMINEAEAAATSSRNTFLSRIEELQHDHFELTKRVEMADDDESDSQQSRNHKRIGGRAGRKVKKNSLIFFFCY